MQPAGRAVSGTSQAPAIASPIDPSTGKVSLEDLFAGVLVPQHVEEDASEQGGDDGAMTGEDAGEDAAREAAEFAALAADTMTEGLHGVCCVDVMARAVDQVGVSGPDVAQCFCPGAAATGASPALQDVLRVADRLITTNWTRRPSMHAHARPGKGAFEWARPARDRPIEAAYELLRPTMARRFPFELDTFQKESVVHMEEGHSVFVAAHTSAGKTVVAEYALALAMQHCTRAIYTSPIKTISNQKFRDFTAAGFEVGCLVYCCAMHVAGVSTLLRTWLLLFCVHQPTSGGSVDRGRQHQARVPLPHHDHRNPPLHAAQGRRHDPRRGVGRV